jgi:hypothetical protein
MDVEQYFRSLGVEIEALKQRTHHIIAGRHWQTQGEWKESVVRQVLRRHLPATALIGRGFVVSAQAVTTQLDVLIYEASAPVLFRDGDLVFITPDGVLGIVEVKSRVTPNSFGKAVDKLANAIELVRASPNHEAFAAIFAFEARNSPSAVYLEKVAETGRNWDRRLSFASLGPNRFVRYWDHDPLGETRQPYEWWHSYRLDGLAHGYFVHNVVDAIAPQSVFQNQEVWFPDGGKEPYRDGNVRCPWFRAG